MRDPDCLVCGDSGVRNVDSEAEAYDVGSYTVPCECSDGVPREPEPDHPWKAPAA